MAQFQFTCPHCKVDVEADDSYRGMVLECPSCGRGIVVPRDASAGRPKLKPVTKQDTHEDINAAAIRRRLAEKEEEEAAEEARRQAVEAQIRKQRMQSMVVKLVISIVLIGAMAYGVLTWRHHRAEQQRAQEEARQKQEEEHALEVKERDAERQKRDAELQKKQEELKQKRLEDDAKRAEAAKLREEKREREREERKRLQEEREKERQERIAAAAAQAKERKERFQKFKMVEELFTKATVDLWKNMPKSSRPGSASGIFYALVPLNEGYGVYEIDSSTNGEMRVVKLSMEEAGESVEIARYATQVDKQGCLCIPSTGGNVYVNAPKGTEGVKYVVPESSVSPSELVWGLGLCKLIRRYSMTTQNIGYDVTYLTGRGKAIPLGRVAFGRSLGFSEIQEAVLAVVLKNWRPPKRKSFRRTVALYDGTTIKNGPGGVTYVPRSPEGRLGSSSNYRKLYDEAVLQDEKEAAVQEEETRAKELYCENVRASVANGHIQVSVNFSEEKIALP